MSFWNIFGPFATSDQGETVQRVSKNTSISTNGTIYNTVGTTTVGSDGSVFTQMGSFSSDGSIRMGNTATGLGAIFSRDQDFVAKCHNSSNVGCHGHSFDDHGF